jgi:NAD-dependent dihydropyrimidine dehydrogenase PreA subunit
MRLLRKLYLPLVLICILPLHLGHGEELLHQRIPRPILRLFSRYEHVFMRTINYLAMRDWIHNHAFTKRLVDRLTDLVLAIISGEILNLEESRQMIENIADHGYTIATGTCPCRRARNLLSDRVPNNTDMVFGTWADEYLNNYPGLYERLSKEEALQLVDEFDRHGFFHQVYGFLMRENAAFVLCNCAQDVCIPLQAQRARGYTAFRKGRSVAVVNRNACVGVDGCGICIERCPFDARYASDGKAAVNRDLCYGCGVCSATCKGEATHLESKPGAQLIFTRNLVE